MASFLFYDDKIINILRQDEKPSGGAAVQAYGWIRGLRELGQNVFIMTNSPGHDQIKEECRQIPIIPLYDKKKGLKWIRWIYYRLPFVYKQIKTANPDYLYQGIPGWTSFILGSICRQLKIKYILRISNDFLIDERFYKRYGRIHRFFQWQGLKMSHCILCQNDYQYGIIKNAFPKKAVYKISNPIAFKRSDIINGTAEGYIAWLGLFQYQKNLKLLYQLAFLLKAEQFHIAGKEEESCDADTLFYVEKLKELPNVKFVGFLNREQVIPFLSHAKYLLNTSHYEGFSNTFLEAMSVGTPIISSEKVNPDSIITNNKLGIIYRDVDDLKMQLLDISLSDHNSMRLNVLEYVKQQHDYRILSDRLLGYLNTTKIAV
jgi:glycosyltransferase involved in cell wall biosynthesis